MEILNTFEIYLCIYNQYFRKLDIQSSSYYLIFMAKFIIEA